MADILYTYSDQVYVNLTNKCDCNCRFCIRNHEDSVGDSDNLWHKGNEPTLEDVKNAIDQFDFSDYKEVVYCGYGEPTCALDILIESAKYIKEKLGLTIRVNTNGLGNLYHERNIVPELAEVVDSISISLNAPTKEAYEYVTQPQFPDAFEGLLAFASECKKYIPIVKLTVVDVIPEEDIKASQQLADELGITLRIRKYS